MALSAYINKSWVVGNVVSPDDLVAFGNDMAAAGASAAVSASATSAAATYLAKSGGELTGLMKSKTIAPVIKDLGNIATGGLASFDFSVAQFQRATFVGTSAAITLKGWADSGYLSEMVVQFVNAGSVVLSWNTTVNWVKSDRTTTTTFSSNGVTLQTSGIDTCLFWTTDGTTIYGKFM